MLVSDMKEIFVFYNFMVKKKVRDEVFSLKQTNKQTNPQNPKYCDQGVVPMKVI